jgi:RHS repeat-associated protein
MNQGLNNIFLLLRGIITPLQTKLPLLLLLQLLTGLLSAQVVNNRQLSDGRLETVFITYPIKGATDVMSGSVYLSKSWTNNNSITTTAVSVPSGQPVATYKNLIMFSLDEDQTTYIPADFTATITVDIAYRTTLGGAQQFLNNQILTIDYKKDKGTRSDVKQYFSFEGAPDVTVTVKSFNFPALSGIDLKSVLVLTNEVREIRYYNAQGNIVNLTSNIPIGGVKDELPVQWSAPTNRAFSGLQLEWAWLEEEMEVNYHIGEGDFIPLLYMDKTNTTRVDLPVNTTNYNIPLLYSGVGRLHFRIRGSSVNEYGNAIFGPWSAVQSFSYTGHESSLNWQSISTFAEGGKRKTAIEYFDGSLRPRQSVTKDNTTNKTITAETLYDLEGRAAIGILPAPGVNDYIGFNKNLNLFVGQVASTQNPAELFDLQPLHSTSNETPALLSTIAGSASQYYSNNNPQKATEKELPNADGFPYTVTRYTADATGRILSQNNVGDAFKMTNGREVKYFYGTATQEELDGLFGTDVGDKSHYSKNMVKDENGQMSVSYVDMHGRTIATALTGNNPNTIQPLALGNATYYPNQNNRLPIVSNLIGGDNVFKEGKYESVQTILVPIPGDYQFKYQLNPPVLTLPTCNNGPDVCYSGLFDLEISIINEAGGVNSVNTYKYTNTKAQLDTLCANINRGFVWEHRPDLPADTIITIDTALVIGSYSIRKTLSLNQAAFEQLKADYLKRGYCVSEQELTDSIYSVLRIASGCDDPTPVSVEQQCSSCFTELGPEVEFRRRFLRNIGMDTTFATKPERLQQEIIAAYKNALASCNLLCGIQDSWIIGKRQQMLMDMYPLTGQYARETSSSNLAYLGFDVLYAPLPFTIPRFTRPRHDNNGVIVNDFYRDRIGNRDLSIHPEELSDYAILDTMGKYTFAKLFRKEWAEALLPYHPEYQRLVYAEKVLGEQYGVFIWQSEFERVSTYAEAEALGFIYTSMSNMGDPLFTPALEYKQPMANRIAQGTAQTDNFSLWQLAYIQIKCGSTNPSSSGGCTLPVNFKQSAKIPTTSWYTSLTIVEKDQLWEAFKALYLSIRNDYLSQHVANQKPLALSEQIFTQSGYRLHFPSSLSQEIDYLQQQEANNPGSGSVWTNIKNGMNNPATISGTWMNSIVTNSQTGNCDAQIEKWRVWLLECPTINNHPNKNTILTSILNQMTIHCKNTLNEGNPYGASTHPTSSAGFEQIITNVLNTYSIAWTDLCNPYVIEFPKPYGKNKAQVETVKTELYSCDCDQFAIIKADAIAAGKNPANRASLNEYLSDRYNDTLSVELFNGYNQCSTLGTQIATDCQVVGYENISHPCDVNPCDLGAIDPMSVSRPANPIEIRLINNLPQLVLTNQPKSTSEFWMSSNENAASPWGNLPGIMGLPENCNTGAYFNPNTGLYEGGYCPSGEFNPATGCCLTSTYCTTSCPITECTPIYKVSIRLARPESIPGYLSCYNTSDCLDCAEFKVLINEFKTKFSGTVYSNAPHFLTGEGLTEEQMSANALLARFINYRTGFQYTWEEYFKAMVAAGCQDEVSIEVSSSYFDEGIIGRNTTPDTDGWNAYGENVVLDVDNGMLRAQVNKKEQGFEKSFEVEVGKKYRVRAITGSGAYSLQAIAKLFYKDSGSNIDSVNVTSGNNTHVWFDFYPMEDSITFRVNSKNIYDDLHHTGPKYLLLDFFILEEIQLDTLSDRTDIMLCQGSYTLSDTRELVTLEDPCISNYYESVELAVELYKTRTESLLSDFSTLYMDMVRAVDDKEKFTVTYTPKEYHYTLYYYDQAGNLVKTIPPRGVVPNYTAAELEAVATARKNNVHRPRAHTHATNYRYNSLNQMIQKENADEGLSKYWYDQLGRLVLSQNANQTTTKYSYTLYDALSRVTEVGQLTNASSLTSVITRDPVQLQSWMNAASTKEQITYTYYDQSYALIMGGSGEAAVSNELTQHNLRKRVSYTAVKNNVSDVHYDAATFYSYDIHGNVKALMQDFRQMTLGSTAARFKKIEYHYDLISGNVNEVAYQPGAGDAFYHRYEYDAENRLTEVYTSRTGLYWERDAAYTYYRHGPLRRTVIGQQQVQGIDYAYTLHGWMKGVNSTLLTPATDIGQDGHTTGANRHVARDVYNFGLHYYDFNLGQDYKNIDGASAFARGNASVLTLRSLFNGNIAGMSVNLGALNSAPDMSKINSAPIFYRYNYDQLNRLVILQPYTGLAATNIWTPTAITDYRENIAYNPNGSITSYNRMGAPSIGMPTFMDRMTYQYYPGNGNKLRNVADTVAAGNYTEDIDNQPVGYYVYDAIGNLIKEGTTDISWNIYGKIKSIQKSDVVIDYSYDATGNRIAKKVGNDITLYVRDATGNVMSLYNISNATPLQSEVHLYGSSRLGINMGLTKPASEKTMAGVTGGKGIIHTFTRGEKFFELSNHLGNVLATVSDKKLAISGNGFSSTISHFEADVVSASDYSPFGMQLVGRNFSSDKYRYGFNGQEKSTEIDPHGNNMTAEFWQYDARLGRRWNVDPRPITGMSPYAVMGNSPVLYSDPLGDTLSDSQLLDALKIANNEVVTRIKNNQNFGFKNKNYIKPLSNAIKDYLATNNIEGQDLADFYKEVHEYYNWMAGAAMYSASEYLKLDKAVINNKNLSTYNTIIITQGFINEANAGLLSFLNISANVSMGEAFGAVGTPSVVFRSSAKMPTYTYFAPKQNKTVLDGSFSITNLGWNSYPSGVMRPAGPFRLLEGAEYEAARKLANSTNAAMRRADPDMFRGLQIHEIHPVKFGGSPTNPANKVFLSPSDHSKYTKFWNALMRKSK